MTKFQESGLYFIKYKNVAKCRYIFQYRSVNKNQKFPPKSGDVPEWKKVELKRMEHAKKREL